MHTKCVSGVSINQNLYHHRRINQPGICKIKSWVKQRRKTPSRKSRRKKVRWSSEKIDPLDRNMSRGRKTKSGLLGQISRWTFPQTISRHAFFHHFLSYVQSLKEWKERKGWESYSWKRENIKWWGDIPYTSPSSHAIPKGPFPNQSKKRKRKKTQIEKKRAPCKAKSVK